VTCWTDPALLVAAVAMALSPAGTIVERFVACVPLAARTLGRGAHPGSTYQGFSKAMLARGPALVALACEHLRNQIRRVSGRFWARGGFVAFVADGTLIDCPRTIANEALGMSARLGTATHPQLLVTCLWHMGLGLMWDWRIGSIFESERAHLRQMLAGLPAGALIVADAGFTGFDLLSAIHASGRSFLVRVGSHTTLLARLGAHRHERRDTVYLWPDTLRHRPPLTLRLIRIGKVYLITNVLDPARLSRAAAGELYRRRWGVEVGFRTLKQTLGRRAMRCAAPRQAVMELHSTLLGLTLLGLMSVRGLIARGLDPLDLSPAAALRAIRHWLRRLGGGLRRLLLDLGRCVKDRYQRSSSRRAWNWPHKKNPPPIRPPTVILAPRSLIARAEALAAP
jgi:hypothetical protein